MSLNEQYLAGALLLEDFAIRAVDGLVTADDFQSEPYRTIYEAARTLEAEGRAIDPSNVIATAWKNSGVDLSVKFMADLMDCVPRGGSVSDYARRVAEDARTRRIKELAEQIQMDGTSTADELLERLQTAAGELARDRRGDDSFLSLFKPLSQFEEEEAEWLIPGWIPEGQITLIAADGGVGKTTLWVNIIAALSTGQACVLDPPGLTREPLKIAFCTTEDSVKKKLRKKLRKAGANMDNIITMDLSADKDGTLRDFNFGSPKMDKFVHHFKPAACAFDPVQGFVPPKVNMGARNEMRHCLAPLIVLGEDVGTTFMIVAHTNKRPGASGRDRIADSADLWDIARSVIMAGYTETKGIRYLSNEKNNYTQLQDTVLFSVNASGQIVREGTSQKRDRDYVLAACSARSAPQRNDCKEFIMTTLRESRTQCMKSEELVKAAQDHGYSFETIKRSRKALIEEGMIENYYLGSPGKKGRVCFVRIKQDEPQTPEELPYEEPVPFTGVSA